MEIPQTNYGATSVTLDLFAKNENHHYTADSLQGARSFPDAPDSETTACTVESQLHAEQALDLESAGVLSLEPEDDARSPPPRCGQKKRRVVRNNGHLLEDRMHSKKPTRSVRSIALTVLVAIVVALCAFKLFATNACVMDKWATCVQAAMPQTLTDEERGILEQLPKREQAASIADAVDELMRSKNGITVFENTAFGADGDAGKAATDFGKQLVTELEDRGLFAQFTFRMERKGAKTAIPIMHQDQMTPYVRGVWETICEEVNKFFVSRPKTAMFDDPEMQKKADRRARELRESKNEKAALSFETASAWYREQKDVIEQKVDAASADGHNFNFLTMNVWFAAGSGKRLLVLDREGCGKAEAKFGKHPNYPGNDSFYMKHDVLKWAIANIPQHLYLTKPKQGVVFWGVGFPVDVLESTPRSVVRGNTSYGNFHSGYVVKDDGNVESGEDRYSVMGPREYFTPRRGKLPYLAGFGNW